VTIKPKALIIFILFIRVYIIACYFGRFLYYRFSVVHAYIILHIYASANNCSTPNVKESSRSDIPALNTHLKNTKCATLRADIITLYMGRYHFETPCVGAINVSNSSPYDALMSYCFRFNVIIRITTSFIHSKIIRILSYYSTFEYNGSDKVARALFPDPSSKNKHNIMPRSKPF